MPRLDRSLVLRRARANLVSAAVRSPRRPDEQPGPDPCPMSEQIAPSADHRRLRPLTISLRPHQSSLLISFFEFFGTRNGAAQRRLACRRVPPEGPLWGID